MIFLKVKKILKKHYNLDYFYYEANYLKRLGYIFVNSIQKDLRGLMTTINTIPILHIFT